MCFTARLVCFCLFSVLKKIKSVHMQEETTQFRKGFLRLIQVFGDLIFQYSDTLADIFFKTHKI